MTGERITLWWVDRYTRGLPDGSERRAEVVSDVWEHRAALGDGLSGQVALVSRCLRGVPADLSWRRASRRPRKASAGAVVRGAGWAVALFAYLLLVGTHAHGASALVGLDLYGGDWPRDELLLYARISGVLLALLAAGALVLSRRPVVGATLIGAGALGTAIAFPWGIAAYGPAAVATVVAAVALAQRRGGRRDVRAAPAEG